MICEPMVWLGFSVSNGFWKTICTELTVLVSRLWISTEPISLSSSFTSPSVLVSSPRRIFASVDLPQPDSPTMATVSASRASRDTDSLAFTVRFSPPPNISLAATW